MYSNKLICDILNYIELNLNSKISINDLENKFYYNKFYIMKLFKKEIGISIFEYINILRIYNSSNEIKNTNNSFTMISMNNGFYSLEYFSETFKKVVGVNPRTYKNFWNYNYKINETDLNTIRESIIYLNNFIENKEKYISNTKPIETPIKKLSIFK